MDKYKNHNSYEMGNKINSYLISIVEVRDRIIINIEINTKIKKN